MTKLLQNKVIVVSGGTKGVGKALCIECARQGAHVVIGGRDKQAADGVLNEIRKMGGDGMFVSTELRNMDDCKRLFDGTMEQYGQVDGFVNYAGVTYAASLTECEESMFDEIFDVNIKAAFFCAKHAVNCMIKNCGGSIIMIGSPHAWRGEKDRAAYACSKGALMTLMEHIAYHYAADKIRCNCVTLGWTATEGELALRKSQGITETQLYDLASEVLPMGRMLETNDYIPGIIYLLSDQASMVSGTNLRITGGQYI